MENDLTIDSSESVQTSKYQRKRKSSLFGLQSNGNANAIPDSNGSSPVPPSGTRSRRLATWADNTGQDIQQLRSVESSDYLLKANQQKLVDSSDNDVTPMIPDLEEVNDYEMSQQVAEPPSAHNQIISFQELDQNLPKYSTFASLDGTDLTQLTHFCLPESQVKEQDITWNWDNLMSDITSKLMSDTDPNA